MKTVHFRMPTEDEIRRGCLAHYEVGAFSFLNNWPPALHELSIPSKRIDLSDDDVSALIGVQDAHGFDERCAALARRLDDLMNWNQHFVRLNTRSPKDMSHPAPPVTCAGRQALLWLACSMRTFDDLCMLKGAGMPASIWLREWTYIPEEWELRCFIRDGELIAITQYNVQKENMALRDVATRGEIWTSARDFYDNRVKPLVSQRSLVMDIFPQGDLMRLIEINPYGSSDPILFGTYEAVENEGGFRFNDGPLSP